jgi:hypothetical protein
MKFQVTLTKEKVVIVNALDKDDLMFKLEKYEKQGWNYEHAYQEAK